MINHFFRLNCQVHYERVSEIHVSGHAAQEELKVMHSLVKPRNFIPVHGEPRHLAHHAQLARDLGLDADRVFILENGDRVELSDGRLTRRGQVAAGQVLVDGKSVGEVGDSCCGNRKHLARTAWSSRWSGSTARAGTWSRDRT